MPISVISVKLTVQKTIIRFLEEVVTGNIYGN